MRYPVIVYPEETGGFSVVVPTLPGCHSQGETLEEALANLRAAVELYLEVLREDGLEPERQPDPLLTTVEV
jgi:predicted RNase H-like HicB family nuclease